MKYLGTINIKPALSPLDLVRWNCWLGSRHINRQEKPYCEDDHLFPGKIGEMDSLMDTWDYVVRQQRKNPIKAPFLMAQSGSIAAAFLDEEDFPFCPDKRCDLVMFNNGDSTLLYNTSEKDTYDNTMAWCRIIVMRLKNDGYKDINGSIYEYDGETFKRGFAVHDGEISDCSKPTTKPAPVNHIMDACRQAATLPDGQEWVNVPELMLQPSFAPNTIVRHFKGGIYKVLGEGMHTETNEDLVIYQSQKDGKVYCRPKRMFYSLVDREKYPNVAQMFRLEKIGSIEDPLKNLSMIEFIERYPLFDVDKVALFNSKNISKEEVEKLLASGKENPNVAVVSRKQFDCTFEGLEAILKEK